MKSQPLPVRSKATVYEKLGTADQPWQSREEARRGGCPHLREQDLTHPEEEERKAPSWRMPVCKKSSTSEVKPRRWNVWNTA